MKGYYYVGLDVHKKSISYCAKEADGTIVTEGRVRATAAGIEELASRLKLGRSWKAGMEATMFTGWIYDALRPHAPELKVGHPLMLRAIVAAKNKSDPIDARTLADLLRCNLFPACYMAPARVRELRRVLRYRNLMVREAVRLKNKTAGLLMEVGAEYAKGRLHGKRYFAELLERLDAVPSSVVELLKMTRAGVEMFEANQHRLVEALVRLPELGERVALLMTIRGVGIVTALTWALEIGDPYRFSCRAKAIGYCGLCSAQRESAGKNTRAPLSKQRNRHLQTILVEAAKMAPRWNPQLAAVYERERHRGANPNRATLAVARKLVGYLLYVDKTRRAFVASEAA
jgi:transposase